MKTSLRIFAILLIGLFAISMVGCNRNEEEKPPPVTATLSHEEKLAGEYELLRFEENFYGDINAKVPPAIEGSMVLQNGGAAYFYFTEEYELEVVSETNEAKAWSATATTITFIDDYGHHSLDYTLRGDVLTMTSDQSDDEGVDYEEFTWKKK